VARAISRIYEIGVRRNGEARASSKLSDVEKHRRARNLRERSFTAGAFYAPFWAAGLSPRPRDGSSFAAAAPFRIVKGLPWGARFRGKTVRASGFRGVIGDEAAVCDEANGSDIWAALVSAGGTRARRPGVEYRQTHAAQAPFATCEARCGRWRR